MDIINYTSLFSQLKEKILSSQQKAVQSVNKELVVLYWEIGNSILENQSQKGWGSKVIDSLSNDLQNTFPKMRQFASSYQDITIVQELLAQLSWYHNFTIIQKVKEKDKIEAEYSLRDINKPIGISEYQITKNIPTEFKSKLPSIEEIEENLENE